MAEKERWGGDSARGHQGEPGEEEKLMSPGPVQGGMEGPHPSVTLQVPFP